MEELAPHYQIILYKKGFLDDMEIRVELSEEAFTDNYGQLEAIEQKLKQQLYKTLSMNPKVRLVEPFSIERSAWQSDKSYRYKR